MKNRFLVLFLLPTLFLTTLYADITTGLVAHYEFEGNVSDSSGNSYNLVSGGTQAYEAGTFGQAYIFNGVDNNLTFDGLPISGDGTISYWIKDSNNTGVEMYLSTGGFDGTLRVMAIENTAELIADTAGNTGDNITSAGTLDGAWHHVAVTFLGTTTKIYIDGIDRALDYDTVEDINISSLLNIGHEAGGFLFTGSLDDVRIYNRALTATDILELLPPKLLLKAHGGAVQFDGAGSYIMTTPISGLSTNNAMTVEGWVNTSGTPTNQWQHIFRQDGTLEYGLRFNTTSGAEYIEFYLNNGTGYSVSHTISADYANYQNMWRHIAATYDGSNMKLYVDGILMSTTALAITLPESTGNGYMGTYPVAPSEFVGSVDEIRIWNVARTQTEILNLMNYQLEGNETGLVAYYNFDERIGNSVVDIAGGDSNGTIEGNVTRVNFLGDGLSFDGIDDNITLSDANFPTGNSAYAIASWIKPNGSGNFGIASWGTLGTANAVVGLTLTTTGIKNYWWTNDLEIATSDLNNSWHHVVAQYDGTTRSIWLDGNMIGSDVPTGLNIVNNIAYIGASDPVQNDFFNGNIAELSIWSKALTQNDINKTMHSSLVGTEAALVGYWPLHEGSGAIAYDKTASANNATIGGATWIDSAPKIFGDKLYTSGGLTSFNQLTVENNLTTPTYAWDGGVPASISFDSTLGTFTHTATETNESFSISANNEYNLTVRTINYPEVAFVYLELNVTNVILADHNITNIQVIGEDGNTENFNIPDVVNMVDGNHNYSVPVYNPDNNFSIRIDVNDTDFSQSYYYNFVDKKLYGSKDYNLSSDFKQEISLVNSSFIIDANLSNYIADIDFSVDFGGSSSTALTYSVIKGYINDNNDTYIEALPLEINTTSATLYDFNTTLKQFHKEQDLKIKLFSSLANNSKIATTLLSEDNASHNIATATLMANLVDLNISLKEIGSISVVKVTDANGIIQARTELNEDGNTSAVDFIFPIISGSYTIRASYKDGNVSSYDSSTGKWVSGTSLDYVFTISSAITLPIVDSNFTAVLASTSIPTATINNQDIYLVKNFDDINVTFSTYDTYGSDINISVEYNSSILEINSSFDPLTYITQAEYDTSYLIVKSIPDSSGTTAVKVTFTNANLLFTSTEFNITVAPYGTKAVAGWNLLSLPVSIDLNSTDLNSTFGVNTNIERLYKFNGRWSYWDTLAGYDSSMSISKFSSLRSTEGFWLKSLSDTNVVYNFEGNITDINSSLNVYRSGWYLMGFHEDHNITEIPTIVAENNISGIDVVDYIYRYEYQDGVAHWEVYSPSSDLLNSIDTSVERTDDNISRYEGVWVYVRKLL